MSRRIIIAYKGEIIYDLPISSLGCHIASLRDGIIVADVLQENAEHEREVVSELSLSTGFTEEEGKNA